MGFLQEKKSCVTVSKTLLGGYKLKSESCWNTKNYSN